jgi:hypothetical protein
MTAEGRNEEESAALRENFLQRLEDIARATVDASLDFNKRSEAVARRLDVNTKALRGISAQLEELNSHIQAFENFMAGLTSTYEEGEEDDMREDILDLVENIGRIAEAFSLGRRGGRGKRP